MRADWRALTIAVLLVAAPGPTASAYLKFGVRVGDAAVDVKWSRMPIRYFVTERSTPEIPVTAFAAAVNRAFATWQGVSTAAIRAEFQGTTLVPPGLQDGRTTLGFLDRPDLDRVLGATSFLLDAATGEIVEADVFFNTRFTWSNTAAGEPGRVDLESVALHEIGHLLGLGHSALGETEMTGDGRRRVIASGAVMFPIAFSPGAIADRQLQPDDMAGISDLYPSGTFESTTGSVNGRVLKDGEGLMGAHVVAFNLEAGTLVGNFALNDRGEFVIAGLAPGHYVLRVEPLDDVDVEGFFTRPIDVNFRASYAARVLLVRPSTGAGAIEIAVTAK